MLTAKGEAARVAARTASTPKCHAGQSAKKPKRIRVYTTNRAYSCNRRRCGLLPTTVIAAAAVLAAFAALILAGMAYEAAPALTICVLCPVAVAATLRELRRWSAER